MRQELQVENKEDEQGNPAGGSVRGTGITIDWQNGPLGRGADRQVPNGAFVEGVVQAALQRLEYYDKVQGGKFGCIENAAAIEHLASVLYLLDGRTKDRERREVEGTHSV